MKYNFFSPKLYIQGIKKIRAAGIASAICVIVLNSIIPIIGLIENSMSWPGMYHREIEEISRNAFAPFNLLFILFAPLMVYLMFSYLNERSKSDFYHSLPQTRSCVFISFTASILTWIFAIILGSSIVNSLLWMAAPYYHLSFSTVIVTFINYFIMSVLMVGFMSLAMNLTGTTISNLLIFILVTLFTRTVGTLFMYSVEETCPVLLLEESWLKVLSFEYFLPAKLLIDLFDSAPSLAGAGLLVYTLLIGIALIAVSCWLYQKRRSEIAGQSAPNKILQMVYRSAVTLPFLLIMVFAIIMEGGIEPYQVILLAIAVLVYALYELMTTKKIKAMLKALPKFYIPVLAAFIFFCSVYATHNSIVAVQPEPEDISGFTIANRISHGSSYEDMRTNDVYIYSDEANEIISEALIDYINNGPDAWSEYNEPTRPIRVIIKLNSGRKIGRRIYVTTSEYNTLQNYFIKSAEYANAFILLPEESMINDIYVESSYYNTNYRNNIWKSFVEEYNGLSKEKKLEYKMFTDRNYNSESISLRVRGYYKSEYFSSLYPLLSEYTPKTLAIAAKETNKNHLGDNPKKALEEYYEAVSSASYDDSEYFYLDANIFKCYGDDFRVYSIGTSQTAKGEATIEGHLALAEFLATSNDIFDFENTDRKLYNISMSADIFVSSEEYESEYEYKEEIEYSDNKAVATEDVVYKLNSFYKHIELYVMLSDEEAEAIFNYMEKAIVPSFSQNKTN